MRDFSAHTVLGSRAVNVNAWVCGTHCDCWFQHAKGNIGLLVDELNTWPFLSNKLFLYSIDLYNIK